MSWGKTKAKEGPPPVDPGVHHTFRYVLVGVRYFGLPVLWILGMFLAGGMGFFIVYTALGRFAGFVWLGVVVVSYPALSWWFSVDPMYIRYLHFKVRGMDDDEISSMEDCGKTYEMLEADGWDNRRRVGREYGR